jgi:hypothetical protein
MTAQPNGHRMTGRAADFHAGTVLVWIGLAQPSRTSQLAGEAVRIAAAWLALGGGRVMRDARQRRDRRDA